MPFPVCGYSGKRYATAHFDASTGQHTVKIPYKDWKSGIDKDVTNGSHRAMSKWIVDFEVKFDESDATQRESDLKDLLEQVKADRDVLADQLQALQKQKPTITGNVDVIQSVKDVILERINNESTASALSGLHYRQLRKIAKDKGLTPEQIAGLTTSEALIAAISAIPEPTQAPQPKPLRCQDWDANRLITLGFPKLLELAKERGATEVQLKNASTIQLMADLVYKLRDGNNS